MVGKTIRLQKISAATICLISLENIWELVRFWDLEENHSFEPKWNGWENLLSLTQQYDKDGDDDDNNDDDDW